MKTTLKVGGMHCKSCEMIIKDVLEEIKGVKNAHADHRSGTVVIEMEDGKLAETIKEAIENEGYKVV